MTIQREEPGMWILYCDGCQERTELDLDPESEWLDALEYAKVEHGYRVKEESHQFIGHRRSFKPEYGPVWTHKCAECASMTLEEIAKTTMTNVVIAIQESRPYGLGFQAFEDGVPRHANPMRSDSGQTKWWYGWDAAKTESQSD